FPRQIQTRYDKRDLAARQRKQNRPDAGMGHDRLSIARERSELLEWQEVHGSYTVRLEPGVAALQHNRVHCCERRDGADETVEGRLIRPYGDENHCVEKRLPTYSASGTSSRSSGHWT